MGSLTSRPKVPQTYQPAQPQVVYVQQPATNSSQDGGGDVAVENSNTPTSSPTNPQDSNNGVDVPSNSDTEVRITNLLRRNRGIGGTIQTGFRGLLSANDLMPKRKTLLGE